MKAEIISIGTELLLGEITDTNAVYLARQLRELGVDLHFKTTVGDNRNRIAEAVRLALSRADIVICTGGLGPTVDDVTREAIADAAGLELELRPELLDQIAARFRRFGAAMSDNNRRQAFIPQTAEPIENPVGTAPIFWLDTAQGSIAVLPGVPREMTHLFETELAPRIRGRAGEPAVIHLRVLRTAGLGESLIDAAVGDLEELSNPTVGLAAHGGWVDLRITAKALDQATADMMIAPIEAELRARLGDWIFGVDAQTLDEVTLDLLSASKRKLAYAEALPEAWFDQRLRAAPGFDPDHMRSYNSPLLRAEIAGSFEAGLRVWAETLDPEPSTLCIALAVNPDQRDGIEAGIALAGAGPTRYRRLAWMNQRIDAPNWLTTHALVMLRFALMGIDQPPTPRRPA